MGRVDFTTHEVEELEIIAFDAIIKEDDTFEMEDLSEFETVINEIEEELS